MSYTKGDLAQSALTEIGIASYDFDTSPEMREEAVARLDMMMAQWAGEGIGLAYPIAPADDAESSEDTGIPAWAWEAVVTNLAIRLAPQYGKQVSPTTQVLAQRSFRALCAHYSYPREMQLPSMPMGAGYKSVERRYFPPATDPYLKPVNESVDLDGEPNGN